MIFSYSPEAGFVSLEKSQANFFQLLVPGRFFVSRGDSGTVTCLCQCGVKRPLIGGCEIDRAKKKRAAISLGSGSTTDAGRSDLTERFFDLTRNESAFDFKLVKY